MAIDHETRQATRQAASILKAAIQRIMTDEAAPKLIGEIATILEEVQQAWGTERDATTHPDYGEQIAAKRHIMRRMELAEEMADALQD
jgi:hypothetical protein